MHLSKCEDLIISLCTPAVKFVTFFFIYCKIHCKCERCITLFCPSKKFLHTVYTEMLMVNQYFT